VQPFDIVVFKVPAPGRTAQKQCLPDMPLDTAHWTVSSNLVIHTMTTKIYDATWTLNNHEYKYTPDCNGWVTDSFTATDGSTAIVSWNTITNQLKTSAASGHPYNATVAKAAAQYAVQTLFPPGDLGLLTIN
jgi:hypothetical protein